MAYIKYAKHIRMNNTQSIEKLFSKITCSCGKIIYEYYLGNHLMRKCYTNMKIEYYKLEMQVVL